MKASRKRKPLDVIALYQEISQIGDARLRRAVVERIDIRETTIIIPNEIVREKPFNLKQAEPRGESR